MPACLARRVGGRASAHVWRGAFIAPLANPRMQPTGRKGVERRADGAFRERREGSVGLRGGRHDSPQLPLTELITENV